MGHSSMRQGTELVGWADSSWTLAAGGCAESRQARRSQIGYRSLARPRFTTLVRHRKRIGLLYPHKFWLQTCMQKTPFERANLLKDAFHLRNTSIHLENVFSRNNSLRNQCLMKNYRWDSLTVPSTTLRLRDNLRAFRSWQTAGSLSRSRCRCAGNKVLDATGSNCKLFIHQLFI